MFILSIASHIMVFALLAVLIGRFTLSDQESISAREQFFNVQWEDNKPFQYAIWSSLVYLVLTILGSFIPGIGVVCFAVRILSFAFSWWWLVETIKCGKVAVWFQAAKAYFDK